MHMLIVLPDVLYLVVLSLYLSRLYRDQSDPVYLVNVASIRRKVNKLG